MRRDYIFSLFTQFIVLFSFLFSYKLISYFYGISIFEQYSIIKRLNTFIIAFVSFSLPIALIRNVAYYHGDEKFLIAGYLWTIFIILVLFALFIFDINQIAFFLNRFGVNKQYCFNIVILIAGILLHNVIYSYLRGKLEYKLANIYDIFSKAGAPFIAIVFANNLNMFLFIHGTYQIILSLFVFCFLVNFKFKIKLDILNKLKILLFYGVKRIFSDLGLNLIFIYPLYFINNKHKGLVSFYLTLIVVIGYLYTPLNNILLSRLSRYLSNNDLNVFIKILKKIYFILISSLLVLIFIIYFNKQYLIQFFISKIDEYNLYIFNYYIFAAFFYVIFLINKNIIDSLTQKAINAKIIILLLFVFILLSYFFKNQTLYISILFILLIIMLAITTGMFVYILTRDKIGKN